MNKNILYTCVIYMCFAFTSCMPKGKMNSSLLNLYRDSMFLEISGVLYEMIGEEDSDILYHARKRLEKTMHIKKGRITWEAESGKDVNIADNIYRYVTNKWKWDNKAVEIGLYKLKKDHDGYKLIESTMFQVDTLNPPDYGNKNWEYGGISYKDSIFLRLEGDLERLPIDREHYWIYSRASNRVNQHLYVENGRIKCNIHRGIEIKISENVFFYLSKVCDMENEKLESGKFEIRRYKPTGFYFAIRKDKPFESEYWERIIE